MLLQNYQRTFWTEDVDYILYSITNDSSPQVGMSYGDDNLPGLDVRIKHISREQWLQEVWDGVEYHEFDSECSSLPEAVMSETLLALFSGKYAGDWKITALGLFMGGLYINIVNEPLMKQYDFLSEREKDAVQPEDSAASLVEWMPEHRYCVYFDLTEKARTLTFAIKDSSGADLCEYEIKIGHHYIEVDESAPHHRRNLIFGEPTEITEPGSNLRRWVYTVDVQEAILFQ